MQREAPKIAARISPPRFKRKHLNKNKAFLRQHRQYKAFKIAYHAVLPTDLTTTTKKKTYTAFSRQHR